jgi:[ribosomal protein S5]-alanine N-acetyltransferase
MSELPDAPAGPQPTIPAGNLLLRPWGPDDDLYVAKAFQDPAIRGWSGIRIDSPEEAGAWIARWAAKWTARSAASWAVVAAGEPGVVLGQVALRSLWIGEMAEISYWVLPDSRGQGIAPRATRALATWALDEFDLTRLEIVHSVRNSESCRVARRAGFRAEGIKGSLQRHEVGGIHDMHLHAMVRPADTPARARDRALLAVVPHATPWTTAFVVTAGLAQLTSVSRIAAILLAAGVLGVCHATTPWPRRRHMRSSRGRHQAVS